MNITCRQHWCIINFELKEFWYQLGGPINTGLSVNIYSRRNITEIWKRSGNLADEWSHAYINLPLFDSQNSVEFEGDYLYNSQQETWKLSISYFNSSSLLHLYYSWCNIRLQWLHSNRWRMLQPFFILSTDFYSSNI